MRGVLASDRVVRVEPVEDDVDRARRIAVQGSGRPYVIGARANSQPAARRVSHNCVSGSTAANRACRSASQFITMSAFVHVDLWACSLTRSLWVRKPRRSHCRACRALNAAG